MFIFSFHTTHQTCQFFVTRGEWVNIANLCMFIILNDFSRGKLRKPIYFNYGDQNIEVVDEYNYLGLVFNYIAKFNVANDSLYQKGSKAMFSLLKK